MAFEKKLTHEEIDSAQFIEFSKYVPVDGIDYIPPWDNEAGFYTSNDNAILSDLFVFEGKAGATYDIFSHSFFDPFILLLYDNEGNEVAADQDQGSYGSDMIFGYVAPYTGKYYVNASWDQGIADGHKFVSISVNEDIDTISPSEPEPEPDPDLEPEPTPDPHPVTNINDRIFNWGETIYLGLFPEHQESISIFGYYARTYSNGDAVGEKGGSIYYYDGGIDGTAEIIQVGTVSDYLTQATAAGF